MSQSDKDYVLGTHDAEIDRLGLQHQVWRRAALSLWERAGISRGSTVIDAGAGPGFASLDLGEIVGKEGRVIALERSERFLNRLKEEAARRGLSQIQAVEGDLLGDVWPQGLADFIWCRWVLAFVGCDQDGSRSQTRGRAHDSGIFQLSHLAVRASRSRNGSLRRRGGGYMARIRRRAGHWPRASAALAFERLCYRACRSDSIRNSAPGLHVAVASAIRGRECLAASRAWFHDRCRGRSGGSGAGRTIAGLKCCNADPNRVADHRP